MAEIINLRKVRKQKARSAKDAQAEQNRISFGRTKAEKQLSAAEKALADKRIDGHRRDDKDQETP
ncbi:DUF4169 family protein [Devosia beringensis]|uniref:DUF4169 family protein n=1 Tax=Devosia beringensis TaxID=2657486 RepID=UPI00186B9589|nr:DUF4169 family protein [Devosia beringensis]